MVVDLDTVSDGAEPGSTCVEKRRRSLRTGHCDGSLHKCQR